MQIHPVGVVVIPNLIDTRTGRKTRTHESHTKSKLIKPSKLSIDPNSWRISSFVLLVVPDVFRFTCCSWLISFWLLFLTYSLLIIFPDVFRLDYCSWHILSWFLLDVRDVFRFAYCLYFVLFVLPDVFRFACSSWRISSLWLFFPTYFLLLALPYVFLASFTWRISFCLLFLTYFAMIILPYVFRLAYCSWSILSWMLLLTIFVLLVVSDVFR